MKKVLVTGATGFIGSYVITELLKRNYEVIASSHIKEKALSFRWYDKVTYIQFDLKEISLNKDYYGFFNKPELLIHLAWEGLPNYKSAFHLEDNLPRHYMFIKNFIENGLKDITVAGTCLEYGMQEGCLSEDIPSLPANPYAIAKNELRLLLNKLQETNPFLLKWIRLFYSYGKGQSPNSLLSQLESAIERGDKTFNMSPGDQLRDYLPVEKVAEYIVAIALQQHVSGIINCCSGSPVEVKQIVLEYIKKVNADIQLNPGYYPYSDIEPKNFWGDPGKLKTILSNEQADS